MYDNKRNLYFIGLSLLFFGKQSEISTFAIQRSIQPYILFGLLPIRCILRINKSRARIKVHILMMDQIRFLNDDVLRNSMKYFRYLSFLHKVK